MVQSCDAMKKNRQSKSALVEEFIDGSTETMSAEQDPGIDDEDIPAASTGSAFNTQKLARSDDSDSDGSSSMLWLLAAAAALTAWWAKSNPEKAKNAMDQAELVTKEALGKALDMPIVQQALAAFGIESSRLDFLRTTKVPFIQTQVEMTPEALKEEPTKIPEEASFEADFSAAPEVPAALPQMDLLEDDGADLLQDDGAIPTGVPPMDLLDGMGSMPPA